MEFSDTRSTGPAIACAFKPTRLKRLTEVSWLKVTLTSLTVSSQAMVLSQLLVLVVGKQADYEVK